MDEVEGRYVDSGVTDKGPIGKLKAYHAVNSREEINYKAAAKANQMMETINEALRVQQRPPRTAGGGPEAYEYVLWDTSYQREVSIGTAEAVQQLIKNLQQALQVPVETLPEAGK